jgi:hypothetical protein
VIDQAVVTEHPPLAAAARLLLVADVVITPHVKMTGVNETTIGETETATETATEIVKEIDPGAPTIVTAIIKKNATDEKTTGIDAMMTERMVRMVMTGKVYHSQSQCWSSVLADIEQCPWILLLLLTMSLILQSRSIWTLDATIRVLPLDSFAAQLYRSSIYNPAVLPRRLMCRYRVMKETRDKWPFSHWYSSPNCAFCPLFVRGLSPPPDVPLHVSPMW